MPSYLFKSIPKINIMHVILAFVLTNIASMSLGVEFQAMKGDIFFAKGHKVQVLGVQCPSLDTGEGLQAKRIANTYLSGSRVKCVIQVSKNGQLVGDCKLNANNGRALSEVLLATGLCRSTSGSDL